MASRKFLRGTAAFLVIASMSVPSSASFAADFATAVQTVLMGQKDGPITELDDAKKTEMVACVTEVLADAPAAARRYVEEAEGFDQTEDRFGELVMANQAEYKQKITSECGEIAL